MPEAPELVIVREVLERRLTGVEIVGARVLRPTVLRSQASEDFPRDVTGRRFQGFARQGKFLFLHLSGDRTLVVNPMLTGALQLCEPKERVAKATCIILSLGNGKELRYLDDRQMGMVYYVTAAQTEEIARLEGQGPDVIDEPLSLPELTQRLPAFHGEIKGILTRGSLVSGIGNAYADEVLFTARVSPFRRRKELSVEEVRRLHEALDAVPREAIEVLRERMGEKTHVKVRDFLRVHNKGGSPCPRCGGRISQITSHRRITSYCLHCQPGLLIRN
ncbi:MAG: Fpg/Nei family DNA glycosylase [Chloroflexi bacterium]|nr:Fpg/Nei family DNA glycosylase [Chloroflexota bacterium]